MDDVTFDDEDGRIFDFPVASFLGSARQTARSVESPVGLVSDLLTCNGSARCGQPMEMRTTDALGTEGQHIFLDIESYPYLCYIDPCTCLAFRNYSECSTVPILTMESVAE